MNSLCSCINIIKKKADSDTWKCLLQKYFYVSEIDHSGEIAVVTISGTRTFYSSGRLDLTVLSKQEMLPVCSVVEYLTIILAVPSMRRVKIGTFLSTDK